MCLSLLEISCESSPAFLKYHIASQERLNSSQLSRNSTESSNCFPTTGYTQYKRSDTPLFETSIVVVVDREENVYMRRVRRKKRSQSWFFLFNPRDIQIIEKANKSFNIVTVCRCCWLSLKAAHGEEGERKGRRAQSSFVEKMFIDMISSRRNARGLKDGERSYKSC